MFLFHSSKALEQLRLLEHWVRAAFHIQKTTSRTQATRNLQPPTNRQPSSNQSAKCPHSHKPQNTTNNHKPPVTKPIIMTTSLCTHTHAHTQTQHDKPSHRHRLARPQLGPPRRPRHAVNLQATTFKQQATIKMHKCPTHTHPHNNT